MRRRVKVVVASTTMPRKLYLTARSPFARKVRIALLEKGLPFETVTVDLAARTPEFLAKVSRPWARSRPSSTTTGRDRLRLPR